MKRMLEFETLKRIKKACHTTIHVFICFLQLSLIFARPFNVFFCETYLYENHFSKKICYFYAYETYFRFTHFSKRIINRRNTNPSDMTFVMVFRSSTHRELYFIFLSNKCIIIMFWFFNLILFQFVFDVRRKS